MDKKEYYIDAFTEYLEVNDKASGTIEIYRKNLKDFIKYYIGTYETEFTPNDVIMMDLKDYRNYLLNVKRQKATTINNKSSNKRILLFLESIGTITKNPSKNIKKIRTNKPIAPKFF